MATAKKAVKATKATKAKKPTKSAAAGKADTKVVKPIKESFTKSSLAAYLAAQTGVEPKAVKSVMASLETTVLASVNKKGNGGFTLPGLLKIVVQHVPAKKKRFGKDPFTGQERWFDPKPATVRVKVRALKKVKDAAS